jgi:hypothetical protein
MNIQDQAAEEMAAQRQQDKHLQDTTATRAEAEVKQTTNPSEVNEQAREGVTQKRQKDEHLRETMLNRSQAEISDRQQTDHD